MWEVEHGYRDWGRLRVGMERGKKFCASLLTYSIDQIRADACLFCAKCDVSIVVVVASSMVR